MPHTSGEPLTDGLPPGCQARCPGCRHRTLSAHESEARKLEWLETRLAPWADRLGPVQSLPEDQRLGYRRRVCLAAEPLPGGPGWRFGMWVRSPSAEARRARELIAIPDCPVHAASVRRVLAVLSEHLPASLPLAFYVQSGAQATLVVRERAPSHDWCTPVLGERLQECGLEALWLHPNPCTGRRLFGKLPWELIWGQARSRDEHGMLYGPACFQQQVPQLYARALDEAEGFLLPSERVVDLYCGLGASLSRWTRAGAQALGVELGAEAVECARQNAPGALLLRGTCAQRLPQLDAWLQGPWTLYANPPRLGLEEEILDWVLRRQPQRIAYMSCSAGTLRRDLELLLPSYAVETLTPYDFFPLTNHVEVVALLRSRAAVSIC